MIDTPNGNQPQNLHPVDDRMDKDVTRLLCFRQALRASFATGGNATMNLIDALCGNTGAKSVAELSLNPLFNYQYASVYDAIDHFFTASTPTTAEAERQKHERDLQNLILPHLKAPVCRNFWLFGLDTTPVSRPYASTLSDRGIVYHPNPILNNQPITVGHQYAALVYLPEKFSSSSPPWGVPLSMRRIPTEQTATSVQAQQVLSLMNASHFGSENRLCVCVVDSAGGTVGFLGRVKSQSHLVTIARMRSNRVLYHQPLPSGKKRGRPKWYGNPFDLKDSTTWTTPDADCTMESMTRGGRHVIIHLQQWINLLMRGTRQYPMHDCPLTLVRVFVTDKEGKPVFRRPLWLSVTGNHRHQLSLLEIYRAYRQRYDLEHFFRFGKQRLLMTAYQTPDVEHEENWWQIAALADVQLFLARELAESLPRPWERYLPQYRTQQASPSMVQRDFGRIIGTIEPPPQMPKRRGKSEGRQKGACVKRREKQKVVKKGEKSLTSVA